MFGPHFYHSTIRKSVAIFGAMFNEIYVVRKGASQSYSQMRVPLVYAPRRKFEDRIRDMINGEEAERQIATKLPRMSFEIINSFNYDQNRSLPKTNYSKHFLPNEPNKAGKKYVPVPYSIPFQLNVYAKTHDDALQVVEQILPTFTPQFNLKFRPIDAYTDFYEDIPLILNGVSFTDDYEGEMSQRRMIVYSLDFEMKVNFYGKQLTEDDAFNIIKRVDVEMYDLDTSQQFGIGDDDSDGYIQTVRTEVDPFNASFDSDWSVSFSVFDKLDSA